MAFGMGDHTSTRKIATYRYPVGGPASEQLPCRVTSKQAAFPNVSAHGGIRGMTGLLPDQMRRDASPRSRGNKPGPQRMPGELRRIETNCHDMRLDQCRDCLARKTILRDRPTLPERPEQRPILNLSSVNPRLNLPHWTPPATRMRNADPAAPAIPKPTLRPVAIYAASGSGSSSSHSGKFSI